MHLQEALYNWLSIKKVVEARPDDHAAQETYDFFDLILKEDHHICQIEVTRDEMMYTVQYQADDKTCSKRFPVSLIDALLCSIEAEPRYNEQ